MRSQYGDHSVWQMADQAGKIESTLDLSNYDGSIDMYWPTKRKTQCLRVLSDQLKQEHDDFFQN